MVREVRRAPEKQNIESEIGDPVWRKWGKGQSCEQGTSLWSQYRWDLKEGRRVPHVDILGKPCEMTEPPQGWKAGFWWQLQDKPRMGTEKSWVLCSLSEQAPEVQPQEIPEFLAVMPPPTTLFLDHFIFFIPIQWSPMLSPMEASPAPPCPKPLSGFPCSVLSPVTALTGAKVSRNRREACLPLHLQLPGGRDSTCRNGYYLGEWVDWWKKTIIPNPLGQLSLHYPTEYTVHVKLFLDL